MHCNKYNILLTVCRLCVGVASKLRLISVVLHFPFISEKFCYTEVELH